jgi:hypothetical protein
MISLRMSVCEAQDRGEPAGYYCTGAVVVRWKRPCRSAPTARAFSGENGTKEKT